MCYHLTSWSWLSTIRLHVPQSTGLIIPVYPIDVRLLWHSMHQRSCDHFPPNSACMQINGWRELNKNARCLTACAVGCHYSNHPPNLHRNGGETPRVGDARTVTRTWKRSHKRQRDLSRRDGGWRVPWRSDCRCQKEAFNVVWRCQSLLRIIQVHTLKMVYIK